MVPGIRIGSAEQANSAVAAAAATVARRSASLNARNAPDGLGATKVSNGNLTGKDAKANCSVHITNIGYHTTINRYINKNLLFSVDNTLWITAVGVTETHAAGTFYETGKFKRVGAHGRVPNRHLNR